MGYGDNLPALEFAGLVKRFGDTVAVDHIDLAVPAGSFFGLVGPNGAGKTTLATALLHNPRLLLLDEPFEAVDPVSAATVRTILQRFAASGGSVIFSSHVMALVERPVVHRDRGGLLHQFLR